MKVFKITCEWDIGLSGCLFKDKETAKQYAKEAFIALLEADVEQTFEECEEAGLINICEHGVL